MEVRTKLRSATAERWFPGSQMPDVIESATEGGRPYGVLVDPTRYYNPILYPGWWVVKCDGRTEVLPHEDFVQQYVQNDNDDDTMLVRELLLTLPLSDEERHLLASPANAQRLLHALAQSLRHGGGDE